jgi:hypothetical protein
VSEWGKEFDLEGIAAQEQTSVFASLPLRSGQHVFVEMVPLPISYC